MTMQILWRLVLGLALLLPGAASSADYPVASDLYVNDLAEVLEPPEASRLRDALSRLQAGKGIQMTVLTIPIRSGYGDSASIESFATGLFNAWGIGRAQFNDGILVLVATEDREMRIELGAGYDQGYDVIAQDIVNNWFLPEFRDGNYAAGIEAGVGQVITRIAERHAADLPPEVLPVSIEERIESLIPWAIGGVFAAVLALKLFGRHVGDWTYRFRRCPTCGQRGLHREHLYPTDPATPTYGRISTTCRHCDYRDDRPWQVRSSGSSGGGGGGSFGGGRSSGGGATGKW
jgi:uncharacterized protein